MSISMTPPMGATVESGEITDGTIVNADVSTSAAVAYSKLATMSTGQALIGNAGVPTATTLTNLAVGATGAVTGIVNAAVDNSAAIAVSKLSHPSPGTSFGPRAVPIITNGSTATGATNRLFIVPTIIPWNATITGLAWYNGATVDGNFRVGLWNSAGTLVAAETSDIAQAGTSARQIQPFDSTYAATPGLYLMGIVFSSATATIYQNLFPDAGAGVIANGSTTLGTITPPSTPAFVPPLVTY